MSIEDKLKHIVTEYDKKESKKKSYNHYGLGLYFQSIEETVIPHFNKTGDIHAAIEKGFNDRLLTFIQKRI